jgi:hypothetical protein
MAKKGCLWSLVSAPLRLVQWYAPVLEWKNEEEYIDLAIEKDRGLESKLRESPRNRELLKEAIQETKKDWKYMLPTSKVIDFVDKNIVLGMYGIGALAAGSGHPIEQGFFNLTKDIVEVLVCKGPYATLYGIKTGDVWGSAKMLGAEAASAGLICGGDFFDLANIYVGTTYDRMATEIVAGYYQRSENQQHNQQSLPEPQQGTVGTYEAGVVPMPELVPRNRPQKVIEGGVLDARVVDIPGEFEYDGALDYDDTDIDWE